MIIGLMSLGQFLLGIFSISYSRNGNVHTSDCPFFCFSLLFPLSLSISLYLFCLNHTQTYIYILRQLMSLFNFQHRFFFHQTSSRLCYIHFEMYLSFSTESVVMLRHEIDRSFFLPQSYTFKGKKCQGKNELPQNRRFYDEIFAFY